MTTAENPARLQLTPTEARVVATLMEKARTVPDSYPLTVNSLVLGCNQKTSRDPVMELSEQEVVAALETLREKSLVHEAASGRVPKFSHNFQRGAVVFEQAAVLLGMLMLRGPQTAAELRLNTERWYRFADISSVEGFLDELQDRSDEKGGPLVVKLSRAPGSREQRWAHLLCGPVDAAALNSGSISGQSASGLAERVQALEAQVARLQRMVQTLSAELGVSLDADADDSGAASAAGN
jgi:uncharacterized protein YceH (UPF0502 family)